MKKWWIWIALVFPYWLHGCEECHAQNATTYVLPKTQPIYTGMIVRCDQPDPPNMIQFVNSNGIPVPAKPRCPDMKCQCHWECENGQTTENYIEDGNQKTRNVGCATIAQPTYTFQNTSPHFL